MSPTSLPITNTANGTETQKTYKFSSHEYYCILKPFAKQLQTVSNGIETNHSSATFFFYSWDVLDLKKSPTTHVE